MKSYLLIILLLAAVTVQAQQSISFAIKGKVKRERRITLDSLKKYNVKELGNIDITNHAGVFKHTDVKLKGILLKNILGETIFDVASPKLLSEFYITCMAADGYKVVYSWNELYNTPVGNNVYIIVEKNGIQINTMPESIQMISVADFKTGRRSLYNLSEIIINQVD